MMLRSSSTPVLGSLLCSLSDSSPNANNLHPQSLNKLPHHQSGCLNLTTVSCTSSPISPSLAEISCIRPAQSDGNLEGLAFASCYSNEEYHISSQPTKFSGRTKCLMLETIPSFSFYNSRACYEDDDEEEESDIEDQDDEVQLRENLTIGHGQINLSNKMENMLSSENMRSKDRHCNVKFEGERGLVCEEMYLARGLGIDSGINRGNGGGSGGSCGGGRGGEFNGAGGDGGDMQGTEEHYKRMLQENPGNPLFLSNYAQFLYEQSKQDLEGAEEYYHRAILADPKDGAVLSQYAKLAWELHHDQDRASSYFERAVQASPEDSHVHAAYASFLWQTEEDEDECNVPDFDSIGEFPQEAKSSAGA